MARAVKDRKKYQRAANFFEAFRAVHEAGPLLSLKARAVLLVIVDRADAKWSAHPSVSRIARESGLGQSAVFYGLAELKSAGVVRVVRRYREDSSCLDNNAYVICDAKLLELGRAGPSTEVIVRRPRRGSPSGTVGTVSGTVPKGGEVLCPANDGGVSDTVGVVHHMEGGGVSDTEEDRHGRSPVKDRQEDRHPAPPPSDQNEQWGIGPEEATEPPQPKTKRRGDRSDLPSRELTEVERAVVSAIEGPVTGSTRGRNSFLFRLVKRRNELARDLVALARPGVDVAREVTAADAWCRANPERAPKKNGSAFLLRWIKRADSQPNGSGPPQRRTSAGGIQPHDGHRFKPAVGFEEDEP